MSDFEVNKWVWRLTKSPKTMYIDSEFMRVFRDANERYEFDPCNNPSDIMPIAIEHKINLEWRDSMKLPPLAKGTGGNESWHSDKKPYRAIAICFLKMKELEK